jgi:hypothetical protein
MSDPAATQAPKSKRPVRTPGGEPAADPAATQAAAPAEVEEVGIAEDPRTPGLVVNEDGTVDFEGKRHTRAFMTPHGMIVPPASVAPPGLNGRK